MGFLQRINSKFLVIALSVIALVYFVVFPLAVLLYDSVLVDGSYTLANYREVYSQDVNWRALANTVELSLIVMVASVIITFPLAKGLPHAFGCQLYDSAVCGRYCLGTAFKPERGLFERHF